MMQTLFGSRGNGCPICLETRPDMETTFQPDGSQIQQQKCAMCGKVWAYQHLTLEQVVVQDTLEESARILQDVACALLRDANTGSEDYGVVMAEIELRYAKQAADHLRSLFGAVRDVVAAAHLAEVQAIANRRNRQRRAT